MVLSKNPIEDNYHFQHDVFLTKCEMVHIDGFLRNRSIAEIAADLGEEKGVVRKMLKVVRQKFHVTSNDELVRVLIANGYFSKVDFCYNELVAKKTNCRNGIDINRRFYANFNQEA